MSIRRLKSKVTARLRSGLAINTVAQCVEELVLNSLDANATCVAVRLDLTAFKVQVIDNGIGISLKDLELAGKRYSTSKCRTLEDLISCRSFGHRGEALASIGEISHQMTIESRTSEQQMTYLKLIGGHSVDVESNRIRRANIQRSASGTTVTILNFLYNMPVRQAAVHPTLDIEKVRRNLEVLALGHLEVSFSLYNDASESWCLRVPRNLSIVKTFANLFGGTWVQFLKSVMSKHGQFKLSGYISIKNHHNRNLQFVFVDRRRVVDDAFQKTINTLFDTIRLQFARLNTTVIQHSSQLIHPVYVLRLECPRDYYDIGLHPSKALIKFCHFDVLRFLLHDTIKRFFEEHVVFQCESRLIEPLERKVVKDDMILEIKKSKEKDEARAIQVQNYGKSLHSLPAKRPYKPTTTTVATSGTKSEELPRTPISRILSTSPLKLANSSATNFKHPSLTLSSRPISALSREKIVPALYLESKSKQCNSSKRTSRSQICLNVAVAARRSSYAGFQKLNKGKQNRRHLKAIDELKRRYSYKMHHRLKPKYHDGRKKAVSWISTKHIETHVLGTTDEATRSTADMDASSLIARPMELSSSNGTKRLESNQVTNLKESATNLDRIESRVEDGHSSQKSNQIQIVNDSQSAERKAVIASVASQSTTFPFCLQERQHLVDEPVTTSPETIIHTPGDKKEHFRHQDILLPISHDDPCRIPNDPAGDCVVDQRAMCSIQTLILASANVVEIAGASSENRCVQMTTENQNGLCHDYMVASSIYPNCKIPLKQCPSELPPRTSTNVEKVRNLLPLDVFTANDDAKLATLNLPTRPWVLTKNLDKRMCLGLNGEDEVTSEDQEAQRQSESSISKLVHDWKNPIMGSASSSGCSVLAVKQLSSMPNEQLENALTSSSFNCRSYAFSKSILKNVRVVGQADCKFIVCTVPYSDIPELESTGRSLSSSSAAKNLVILFDQHAVHERIRLEKALNEAGFGDNNEGEQKWSFTHPPLTVCLPREVVHLALQHRVQLARFVGVNVSPSVQNKSQDDDDDDNDRDETDGAQLMVHSLPTCLLEREASESTQKLESVLQELAKALILEVIDDLMLNGAFKTRMPKVILERLKSQACRGAFKFGDRLDVSTCKELMVELQSCVLPFQCAHGRPSVTTLVDLRLMPRAKQKPKPNLHNLMKLIAGKERQQSIVSNIEIS